MLDSLGRPLRDLRISVTDRCNMRCAYCMPREIFGPDYAFLPQSELLSFDEIERVARIFVQMGVSKLRITGGEPLVRKGLPDLIARLSSLDGVEDIALTTNGLLLPQLAQPLKEAGLRRVTISLDALDDATFGRMNGLGIKVERVLRGIDAAHEAGFELIKINSVIKKSENAHAVMDLAEHFRGTPHTLRFIEFMDVGNHNQWDMKDVLPSREILAMIQANHPLEPVNPNYKGEVARRYRYLDGQGEIGFISSVTDAFCGTCSRARISSDGQIYTCLFGTFGYDLRAPLRAGETDEQLLDRVAKLWSLRTDRYSEERAVRPRDNKIEMSRIGG
ncbi:GTP 3',8-cyclase MoaA [Deinococcus cellulosilyticus]|uniref:GTP 3',8-cyclase n=1 Tax=Deinococcus cellulosilyticus (strain DSM 18568 / NBRC 106333 / KACC 11606 / 5516J-15) TaxID=1223518 RepID=A0A511N7H9_DEIC1|nr:GTP 3',8-cyclase MoaA [Deinococcus cellulosilyticus]GEM48793.1 GTP 3',8-cyclase [Deinococcus cellulosilyticus NBRC 106333 = KACC 11606]